MRSQVISEDRSRLSGRGTARKVRKRERRGRKASNKTKKRILRFRVRFGRERRARRLPCLSFGLGDDRRSMSGGGNVSLAIFITSVSCNESLTSFTNRFFHFSRPPGFRMASDMIFIVTFNCYIFFWSTNVMVNLF